MLFRSDTLLMRHCVSLFYCTFVFLYNIVSGQLALLLLIKNNYTCLSVQNQV